jgi:pimeloyl-ACP methyl ester carboxylesterase
VGHSIGGLYARAFDSRYDGQVAGILLLDSAHEEQIWRFAQNEPDALSEYPRWRDQQFMASQGFLPPGQRLTWRFSKPLIVIEHGIPPEPVWHAMQKDLASRSPSGQILTATRSSHYIQKLQPQLVVDKLEHLRASPCKPWRDSTNEERLNGENGLLLTPSIDHLFDRGFISFEDKGRLIVSPVAHRESLNRMGVETESPVNVGAFSEGQLAFLDHHRNYILLQSVRS